MDKIEVLQDILSKYPSIIYHHDLQEDILKTILGSGYESNFFSVFLLRLKELSQYGYNAYTLGHKKFKKLSYAPNMYSMHIITKDLNYRILYSFDKNNKILLYGFEERAGKRKSDYTLSIQIANRRRIELIGR